MKLFLIGMHICIVLHRTFKGSPRETASKRVNKFFKCSLDKKGFSVSKKRVLLANPLMVRKHAVVRTFVMFLRVYTLGGKRVLPWFFKCSWELIKGP